MSCKINYIEQESFSENEKQRLTDLHLEIFKKAKESKAFRTYNDRFYTIKNEYPKSTQFIASINQEYNKLVARIEKASDGSFLSVDVLPLSNERQSDIFFQKDELPSSEANEATLKKVKGVIEKMGISLQDLSVYAKAEGFDDTGINALADTTRNIIAVAKDRESVALTEEMVHIATQIVEQTNPKLITNLISKIDKYQIYKDTLKEYKNSKYYQLENGKPDIRKIKKEAVDKFLVELIIKREQGETQYPELLHESTVSMAEEWWRAILDFINNLFNKTTTISFEELAEDIIEGRVEGEPVPQGVFLQISPNKLVDDTFNNILDKNNRMALVDATGTTKRHYTFDGKDVDKSVTEKIKEGKGMGERTPEQQIEDDQKRLWGSEGHEYIANFISTNLIDKDGYALKDPKNIKVATKLDKRVVEELERFTKELIYSYPEGTRFLVEKMGTNLKNKQGLGLASTMDFIAIEPVGNDFKVDVLDWKFANINTDFQEDVPWYKKNEWNDQMGEYTKILHSYGIKPNQIRKARMIPFQANYVNKGKIKKGEGLFGKRETELYLASIEIGNLNVAKETKLYLLPVPIETETTGSEKIDRLVRSLREYYRKFYKTTVSPELQAIKNAKTNEISQAIRSLHVKKDFEPLSNVGKTFLVNAADSFKKFENVDYTKLSLDEINDRMSELLEIKESAQKFTSLDEVFLSYFSKEGLSQEEKEILSSLEHISNSTKRMLTKVDQIFAEVVREYAANQGVTIELTKEGKVAPEKEISGFAGTFLEGSKLSSKIIRLASNLLLKTKSLVAINTRKAVEKFEPLFLELEKEAKSKGKTAFEMIGTVNNGNLELIKKIDKEFTKEVYKARKDKDKDFFIKNMDMEKYTKLSNKLIEDRSELEKKKYYSDDKIENDLRQSAAISRIKKSLNIKSKNFNGFEDYDFKRLFWESLKEEEHLSKEFKEMSPSARKVWQYFTDLNTKAKKLGYLGSKQGMSFFPLMEATIAEKLWNARNKGSELVDIYKDLYTIRAEEEYNYSKIDEETGQVKKEIPKLFTRSNKAVHQLSKDLNKVGILFTKALLEYEASKGIENILLTMHSVEKAKGRILVDSKGNPIMEGGEIKTDESQNKNADILQTIIDDGLYGLGENLDSIGNIGLSSVTEKFKEGATEEEKEKAKLSTKKTLQNANKLVQSLAVGLKLLVAIPNYFGVNMQAFINSGRLAKFSEFEKNNAKVTTGALSNIEKGLINTIVPLNDNISQELRRKLAKKEGFLDYLSTWTFHDVMMVTNSFPDRLLQMASSLSIMENTMVVDGKLVNIRQYVREQDRKEKEGKSYEERRQIERTYEKRVKELKDEKSLPKVAKIDDIGLSIPGVSDEELAKFRVKIIEYNRNLTGQMNNDNKADYRRDTILKSFMMFKGWIPKQFSIRTLDIQKNLELDQWEYGRTRVFLKTIQHLGLKNITDIRDILLGTDKGLNIISDMYKAKKDAYFNKTGQNLDITEEEFQDLIRTEIQNQAKELYLLVGLIGLFAAVKLAEPPEDEDPSTLNRYKFIAKAANKIMDELWFYYNPLSFESMTRGSVLPALGILTKAQKFIYASGKLGYGYAIDDEEIIEKAHPTKYFLNLMPIGAQFQNEILPLIDPELSKQMGIRVTEERPKY